MAGRDVAIYCVITERSIYAVVGDLKVGKVVLCVGQKLYHIQHSCRNGRSPSIIQQDNKLNVSLPTRRCAKPRLADSDPDG